jgi:hypothetical protein
MGSHHQPAVRLRQAVLAARQLDPATSALRAELGLGEPFRDPGVAEFGLTNAVFALGECFVEVVVPARPDTAAGRFLERDRGGGYMLIFDLEDLEGARARAQWLGIRVVWQVDLPDISGTHLHPADMRGAIVSLDRSRPYGTWRWGGPEWIGAPGSGAPGRLTGVTVAVAEPELVAARWAQVLGVEPAPDALVLDNAEVRFVAADRERGESVTEIAVELPSALRRGRESIELEGVRFRLSEAAAVGG